MKDNNPLQDLIAQLAQMMIGEGRISNIKTAMLRGLADLFLRNPQ